MTLLPRFAVVAIAAAAATVARAQLQPMVMRNAATRNAEIVTGRWSAGTTTGVDLMALNAASAPGGSWWARGDLLTRYATPYSGPASVFSISTGWFDATSTGAQPDVLWGEHVSSPAFAREVAVTWSAAKSGPPDPFLNLTSNWVWGGAAVRLLPRAQAVPVLVSGSSSTGLRDQATAVDFADARLNPLATPPTQAWSMVGSGGAHLGAADGDTFERVYPLALSPAALAPGIFPVEDAVIPLAQGFYLLWHDVDPPGATLAASGVLAVEFGKAGIMALTDGGFLPPGAPPERDILGAATADVDGDGIPDLVFSYGSEQYPDDPGWLLWIRNTGDVFEMAAPPWRDLKVEIPELGVITDPGLIRSLDLGLPDPAFAVFDRSGGGVYVVTGNGAAGFEVAQLPVAGGATIRDMVAADVVGSPAKDLVVIADLATIPITREIWVYPDDGDLAPRIAWAPEPPASTPMGVDLTLAVSVTDPDSPAPAVTWLRPPYPDEAGSTLQIDGATLCDPVTPVSVTARAVDDLGVYVQLQALITLEERPSLGVVGVPDSGQIEVRPGGVTSWAGGEAWPRCGGSPVFEWSEVGLAGITKTVTDTGSTTRNDFVIPESAYPDLLDGDAALSLRAYDAAALRDGTALIPLDPDARSLVAASVAFDQAALAPGEVAVARATVESRIGVPLPGVRIAFRLDRLAFAGPVECLGTSSTPGAAEGEIVLEPLPASGSPVEVRIPVRSLGRPGAVAVELFSEGGFRVTPETAPSAPGAPTPGCGCGDRGAGPLGLLLLVLPWVKRAGSSRGRARDERAAQAHLFVRRAAQRGARPRSAETAR